MKEQLEKLPYGKRPEVRIRGGVSQEKRDFIQVRYAEQFRGDHNRRDLSVESKELAERVEYKKGECEKDYIKRANELINEIMVECGGTPFDILEDNIYFVDEDFFKEKFKNAEKSNIAYYLPKVQAIVVRGDPSREPVKRMMTVAHEMIHAKEFVSVHAKEDRWGARRLGMSNVVRRGDNMVEIGKGLNEAVVARLEKRISQQIFEESIYFKKEREAQKKNEKFATQEEERVDLFPGDLFVCGMDDKGADFASVSYPGARRVIDYLIRGIALEVNTSEDQAERVFYGAYFDGDLSSWAKIKKFIEKTFGNGAFDQIMQMQPSEESASETLQFLQQRRPLITPQSTTMKENNSLSKSPYEQLIPNRKQQASQEGVQSVMTEEEMIRNAAWHGEKKGESDEEFREKIGAPRKRATVHSLQEQRLKKLQLQEAGEVAEETARPEITKPSAAEMRTSREQEEKEIEAIAKDIFERRMQGVDAAGIDKILADKGIRPWTPEAEEFMRKWDWEQAEQVFKGLEQERMEATQKANEAALKQHIELHEFEQKYVEEKFAAFGIDEEALKKIEGFDMLSYGQRLLLAENLQQLTLGRVQEEAVQKYQEDTKQAKFLGKVWRGVTKKYQIAKHEKSTANDITKGGLEYHGAVLKQLVEGTQRMGIDVVEGKGGILEFQYVEAHPMMTERQKEESKEFNRIATAYSKVPYEWSLDTAASTQKREYQRAFDQFEKAKEHILHTEKDIIGDKDALLFVSDIENKIRLNQFFNTHPDAEKQLQSIESDPVWNKAMGSVVTDRGLYFGAGVATRTFATSLLGAVGFPLAAIGMGGWMGRKRAAEALREREKGARYGKKDASAEAANVVTADALARKIEGLVHKIEGEENDAKRQQLLASLQVRLEYTQNKIEEGLVDFGSAERRIVNQYGLMDKLATGSSTFAVWDVEQGGASNDSKKEVKERLDQFLQFKDAKISKAQRDYLRKQMIYGAGLGVAAFAAGYYVRDVLHAAGPTEAHANSGGATQASTMKDHIPTHPKGPQPMPAHGSVTFGRDLSGGAEHAAVPAGAAKAAQEAAPAQEAFHGTLDIGKRGPEGAFIDELKKHPEIAQRLGIKDIGKEAHTAWAEFAKQELKDPRTQDLLEKLGYPKTQQGYGEMMRHIDHGKIMLEEHGGKLHMRIDEDSEYLRARPRISMPKAAVPTEDVATGPQIYKGVTATEKQPVIDVDKAFREQPIEGIPSPMTEMPRPSVEVFADHTFGLDSDEYNAIKGVQVKTLLEQIPSRDEAWAIWRGEVAGKEITLPHDGIYGAMEFKKHIDLAEHMRALHPGDADMQGSVDAFIKDELRKDIESRAAHHMTPPIVESHQAVTTPIASHVEDVATGQQIMESVPGPVSPEKLTLLADDIYNSKVPVQKIITQYKVGNITPEDFANYYEDKVAHAKPSSEMLKNIKKTFSDATGEGFPVDRANAQNAINIMVKRMQGIK